MYYGLFKKINICCFRSQFNSENFCVLNCKKVFFDSNVALSIYVNNHQLAIDENPNLRILLAYYQLVLKIGSLFLNITILKNHETVYSCLCRDSL